MPQTLINPVPVQPSLKRQEGNRSGRPRVLLLLDKRHWAFDHSARQMAAHLKSRFDFEFRYVADASDVVDAADFDLLFIYFWGERSYRDLGFPSHRIIKQVSSHRWEDDAMYGPCTPIQLAQQYLNDAAQVSCTSRRLFELLRSVHPHVVLSPNGYDPEVFHLDRQRAGDLVIGWAGNAADPLKGFADILEPACADRFSHRQAAGNLSHDQMNQFYNGLDAFAVASRHEGEPLTFIEAMAAGCFPVCNDVGIVPELVRDGVNGLIVRERTPAAYRAAFEWCSAHLIQVREQGNENARRMRECRTWKAMSQGFGELFDKALLQAARPRFRNDDVSFDTSFDQFKQFCEIFWRHNLVQLHGVTLRGLTNCLHLCGKEPVEYEGQESLSKLPNEQIRRLSEPYRIEDNPDLIRFLNDSPDEIALHGLYHSDYSRLSAQEQADDILVGLQLLRELFPCKAIRHFIAPFNRTSADTYKICRRFGLEVLAVDGVHLEAELSGLKLLPDTWHRYHHHRFYPETRCRFYPLSLQRLDEAMNRAMR
jgi:glycosyltransferase involved in cell wall biosynthesis